MSRITPLIIAVLMSLATVGCSTAPAVRDTPSAYQFRISRFDFREAWSTLRVPEGVAVEGIIKNHRFYTMQDVSVEVSLLRDGDKRVARGTGFVAGSIDNRRVGAFDVLLKNSSIVPGDRLRFVVSYRGVDGQNFITRNSIFTVDALTGVPLISPREVSTEWE